MSQIDWKEKAQVQLRKPGNWVAVYFLVMLLCFSRRPAIVVRVKKDQESFLSALYTAVVRSGGVTEFISSDCIKTAVKVWNGRNSEMNADYKEFLKTVDTQRFPARPGSTTDKGKVEKRLATFFAASTFGA